MILWRIGLVFMEVMESIRESLDNFLQHPPTWKVVLLIGFTFTLGLLLRASAKRIAASRGLMDSPSLLFDPSREGRRRRYRYNYSNFRYVAPGVLWLISLALVVLLVGRLG